MITDQHDNTQRPLTTAAPNSTREDHIPTGTQDNHDMYCTKPFTGNYRGFSWNTEALMATSIRSQHRKGQQTCNLIAAHDFGTLSEVHGTPGKAEAYQLPPGTTAHWSHLSTSRAGIGLLVTNTFTKRFLPFQTGDWTELEPGRIGRLRLRGVEGNLDIYSIYLTTGESPTEDAAARARSLHILNHHLAPKSTTLSIISGDWNFVTKEHDRWCHSSRQWTGGKDHTEAKNAHKNFLDPQGLFELQQENCTYFSTLSTSRLDRIYTNHHTLQQLDHKFGCTTLPRTTYTTDKGKTKHLSSHAPVSFYRCKPTHDATHSTTKTTIISNNTINHPTWPARVASELHRISTEAFDFTNPLRRLVLAKRAMQTVSRNMTEEHIFANATTDEDKLSTTLSFIRAAQNNKLAKMKRKASEYPHIRNLVNVDDPNICHTNGFDLLMDHAATLARNNITEEIKEIQRPTDTDNDYHKTIKKKNVLTALQRLLPGSCTSIGAIQRNDNTYATTPEDIATKLARHWANNFKKKPIDKELLTNWLRSLPHITAASTTPKPPNNDHHHTNSQQHNATTNDDPSPRLQDNHNNNNNITATPALGPHARRRTTRGVLPTADRHWRIRRRDIEHAIKHSGSSAPGPDGIPFRAWRTLGPLATSILFAVAQCLETEDAESRLQQAYYDEQLETQHSYNESILVCLPKKKSTTLEDGTDVYQAQNTRPLNIVNADNRLMASAARNRWETHLARWILPRQQGFLPGRSILANLIDVDNSSMITSLHDEDGALMLMDFASAFPSISQEFMFTTLRAIGIPQVAIRTIQSLYSESYCQIRHGNCTSEGFHLDAGVRQGCPLSPLIYATVAEVLMDKIEDRCPDTLVRAYADDTALVLRDFWKEGPILQQIFKEFGDISGLRLNLSKCITIPLGRGSLEDFEIRRSRHIPQWQQMQVRMSGKYLGFMVGPGKHDSSWESPLQKYAERCSMWNGQALGLQYQVMTYNVFAVSTLSFISQLESPPADVEKAEQVGIRRAIPGPYGWCSIDDLWHLKEHFGQARSAKSIHYTAQAAQLRVWRWDPACRNPHFLSDLADLHNARKYPWQPVNAVRWQDWYDRGFAITLEKNFNHFQSQIHSIDQLYSKKRRHQDECSDSDGGHEHYNNNTSLHNPAHNATIDNHPTNITDPQRHNHTAPTKQNFQRNAYNAILKHHSTHPTTRIRHKHERWELQNLDKHRPPENTNARHNTPAWQARRTLHCLQTLSPLVAPRVSAAVFSTICNRWNTERRWQRRRSPRNTCLFGCSGNSEDSIEHYCKCRITRQVLQRYLHLPQQQYAHLHSFLLCNSHITSTETLTTIALLIYGVYNATNQLRYTPPTTNIDMYDFVVQHIRQGCKGHDKSASTLDNRWHPEPTHSPIQPIPYTI